jgi:hypothetical protein
MAAVKQRSSAWAGWVGFAGWLMLIIGMVDFFEGLIAVIRGQYYVLTSQQIIVFDVKTWGWITLLWGIVLVLAGYSLLARATWARWFAIVVVSLGLIEQLGFLGQANSTLWALTAVALTIVVLYALIARWDEASATD